MKRRWFSCTTALLMLLMVFVPASACTIFNASRDGRVLVGNNEDHDDPYGMVCFEPASQGLYGNVTFGFSDGNAQGGMNDQGLFFDFFAAGDFRACPVLDGQILPSGETVKTEPTFQELLTMYAQFGMPSKKMLQTCATVEEAIAFFRKHYEGVFGYAYIMLVDKTGASATLTWSWDKSELAVSNKIGEFQVIGVGSKVVFRQMNGGQYELNSDVFRNLLDKTSMDITAYSNVYDLNRGYVTIYQRRNFEQPYHFLLADELKKGRHTYLIADLFPAR